MHKHSLFFRHIFPVALLGATCALGSGQAMAADPPPPPPPGVSLFNYYLNGEFQPDSQLLRGGSNPIPLDSPVIITFSEYRNTFSFSILGETFNTRSKGSFSIGGAYWGLSFNISQDGDKVNADSLSIRGNSIHLLDPDDSSGGSSVPAVFEGRSESIKTTFDVFPNPARHANGHVDKYSGSLSAPRQGGLIIDYTYALSARHIPVPAPAPLPILGLGVVFGYTRKLRQRIKSSKPEVISTTAV
jgi:hypothetical protein